MQSSVPTINAVSKRIERNDRVENVLIAKGKDYEQHIEGLRQSRKVIAEWRFHKLIAVHCRTKRMSIFCFHHAFVSNQPAGWPTATLMSWGNRNLYTND